MLNHRSPTTAYIQYPVAGLCLNRIKCKIQFTCFGIFQRFIITQINCLRISPMSFIKKEFKELLVGIVVTRYPFLIALYLPKEQRPYKTPEKAHTSAIVK